MRTFALRRTPVRAALQLGVAATAALLILGVSACADLQTIYFQNHLDRAVTVQVDGDRVLIIAPGGTEGLFYSAADWNWPRIIEVRDFDTGDLVLTFAADAPRLIRNRWRVDIR